MCMPQGVWSVRANLIFAVQLNKSHTTASSPHFSKEYLTTYMQNILLPLPFI